MTKQQKITLSASRDIPFNKLMLSQSNVRHVKAGVSIVERRAKLTHFGRNRRRELTHHPGGELRILATVFAVCGRIRGCW